MKSRQPEPAKSDDLFRSRLDQIINPRHELVLLALAKHHRVPLRQSYLRVGKQAVMMSGRYRHAKQIRRARKAEKFVRVRLGRVIRDICRQIGDNEERFHHFREALKRAGILYRQQQRSPEKCYS